MFGFAISVVGSGGYPGFSISIIHGGVCQCWWWLFSVFSLKIMAMIFCSAIFRGGAFCISKFAMALFNISRSWW